MESPEVLYEDVGRGEVVDRQCTIELDPLFLEVVEGSYEVFLQGYDEYTKLYPVIRETSFDVISDSDIEFGYRVIFHRKGHVHKRMESYERP